MDRYSTVDTASRGAGGVGRSRVRRVPVIDGPVTDRCAVNGSLLISLDLACRERNVCSVYLNHFVCFYAADR